MTSAKIGAGEEFARNWPVVLAGALGMALASVSVYTLGIFIQPLEQEFGWTRAEIVAGMTVVSFFGVISAPLVGFIIDRIGPRRLGVIGVIAVCLTLALLSFAGPSIWSWWLLWIPLALAGKLISPTIWTSGVSSLFDTGRGMALALVLSGTALCSTLTPILGNFFIESVGWRQAFIALGTFWGVLVIPMVWFFFSSAQDRHRVAPINARTNIATLSGVVAREALLSGKFFRLATAGFLASLIIVSLVTGLVPILTSLEIDRNSAAAISGLVGVSTVVGRLAGGYLLDRTNGNLVAAASLLLPIIPCALLLAFPGSIPIASAAVLVLGLSLGVELDAVAFLVGRHFGMLNYGVLFGTVVGLLTVATGLGPLLISFVYDATKSYNAVLLAYIPLCLLTSALFASLGRYPVFDAPAAAPPDGGQAMKSA